VTGQVAEAPLADRRGRCRDHLGWDAASGKPAPASRTLRRLHTRTL